MIYRKLGGTGREVSVIGLGCEHIDRTPYEQVANTIDAALECGVNIMDVFMPGTDVRAHIAKALGKRRSEVIIQGAIGSVDLNAQYDISRDMPAVEKYFGELLRLFGGYIDVGMLFYIDSEDDYKKVFDTAFVTYAQKLKKQGDIHHIGFSSHNPDIAMKVINTGVPEVMMFSINPAFDMLPSDQYIFDHMEKGFGAELFRGIDEKRASLYKLCEQKQVGITVMKTFGGGKLLSKEHTPFAKPLTTAQCVHYALSRPAVACVLPGCKTDDEVHEVMKYFELGEDDKNYIEIINTARNDFKGSCVYCSHCQPCPAGIDIAMVNKYLDVARLDASNIPLSIKAHYRHLPHGGGDCTACGSCEARCPFDVPIIENMEEAERLLN